MKININENVKVKVHDKGIELLVKQNNELLPPLYHISFKEKKAQLDKDGYLTMQIHYLMDRFGSLGLSMSNYIDLNIILNDKT